MSSELTPQRSDAISALANEFGAMLGQVRRLFRDAADRVSPGMMPGTYQLLTAIARHDGVTASLLAENMQVDKSLISRGVHELERLELVERTPDPEDRRSSLLTVTEFGRARLDAARFPMRTRFEAVLGEWPEHDVVALTRLLHALTTSESFLGDAPVPSASAPDVPPAI